MSDSVAKLSAALAEAQKTMKGPSKDRVVKGANYSYKYADMEATAEAVHKALAHLGVSVIQPIVEAEAGRVGCWTVLQLGDECISSYASMPASKNDVQGHGSALTYLQRRCLLASVGMAPEEDDDGAYASNAPAPQPRPQFQPPGHNPQGPQPRPPMQGYGKKP